MDEPYQRPAQRGYSKELGWHWLLLDDGQEVLGLLQPRSEPYHHQGTWELVELDTSRTEVKRLRAGLEMIRDREALEPSQYIAAYGEPVGSPGDLAHALLEEAG